MVSTDEGGPIPGVTGPAGPDELAPWWRRWLAGPSSAAVPPQAETGPDTLSLSDGRRARLRSSRPDDAAALGRFYESLAPTTRRMRFHGVVNHLPMASLQAMVGWPASRGAAWLALADDGGGPIVAEARYVLEAGGAAAEFALVVAEDWQGRGLARRLLARLAHEARRQGVSRLRGDVLAENQRMKALMQGLGAELRPDPRDAGLLWVHWPL